MTDGVRPARLAWRILQAPFGWLGPQAARSGIGAYRRTRVLLTIAIAIANLNGAIVVFVFAAWVIPNPEVDDSGETIIVNLVAAAIYVLAALVVGIVWGTRRLRSARAWLAVERDPNPSEQRQVLRGPARIALVAAALWALAVPTFAILNLLQSPALALTVAITVALGGITTSAVAYLLSERMLRAVAARALAASTPERAVVPGVLFRSLLAWALGTGVPIVGLLLVAVFALADSEVTRTQLAVTILGLGGVALAVGLLVAILAARAASDPVMSVRDAMASVERGEFDVEVPVYDGSEAGLLQAGFNRMVAGLRERERIRKAFGTYVDHQVAEHILEEGVALEGEEVDVTLMFVDVRDFTAWAENVPAREMVECLNRLFETAVPAIHAHRGHVDKFVGDGLLAVFGAPQREPEHADEALAAALEIAHAVEGSDDGLQLGIGLNSGRVVAGNVGGAGRLDFSVMGDAVNVAARIEAATRQTGDVILLSEHTASRLGRAQVELEPRPDAQLKGKSESVAVLAVRGSRGRTPGR